MKKTKLVHIVEAMLGGIRRHVVDIIENLDQDQYDITLIYSDRRADKAFFEEKEKLGRYCRLILCNEMQREIGPQDFRAYKAIEKHLKAIEPDIVHCHSSKAGLVGRLAAKHCHVPKIIYTPNAYAFESPDIGTLKKNIYIFAERYLSRHATTMTINVSKGERDLAKKHTLDREDKFTLIYNGIPDIELPSGEELKKELSLKQDVHYVGVTARCARQKDPMTFLKIAEQVVKERPDVEFLYNGDGEMMEEMKRFVEEHGLQDAVHLSGFQSDAGRMVGALDVYLSTALYEGLPYSMMEAMRAGVPVVATDAVGNHELVVDGVNGKLFPIGDVKKGAEILLEQLEKGFIQPERVREAFRGDYSLAVMMDGLKAVYGG